MVCFSPARHLKKTKRLKRHAKVVGMMKQIKEKRWQLVDSISLLVFEEKGEEKKKGESNLLSRKGN